MHNGILATVGICNHDCLMLTLKWHKLYLFLVVAVVTQNLKGQLLPMIKEMNFLSCEKFNVFPAGSTCACFKYYIPVSNSILILKRTLKICMEFL